MARLTAEEKKAAHLTYEKVNSLLAMPVEMRLRLVNAR